MIKFKDLDLIEPIQKAVAEQGYTTPTPIQEKSIPEILAGKDILGYAQTGTGKTAAFTLPILQFLERVPVRQGIKALIVTPTRELAIQIDENLTQYSHYMDVKHTVVFGGVNAHSQINALKQGVHILVATPGRLLDLQSQGYIDLRKIEYFVLDEADRMLDMGFIHDIKRILKLIPKKRQTLFFSATMPKEIEQLAAAMLKHPKTVEIEPQSSTVDNVQQQLYYVTRNDKNALLIDLLKNKELESVLIFTRTKHGADKVVKSLAKVKITAAAIHGNKSQNARQRALSEFKEHKLRVLVATDIAARGIDVDSLSHVINYELPNIPETYVHRIGRTARAGKSGIAISFCNIDERPYLKDIEKLIRQRLPVIEDHPYEANTQDELPAPPKQQGGRRPARNGSGRSGKSRTNSARSSSSARSGNGARSGSNSGSRSGSSSRAGTDYRSGGNSDRRRTSSDRTSSSKPRNSWS